MREGPYRNLFGRNDPVSVVLPLLRKSLVERVQSRLIKHKVGAPAFGGRHAAGHVRIPFPSLLKQRYGFRIRFDVDASPSTSIKTMSVGKPYRMMCTDIDIESGFPPFEQPVNNQILAFLGE